MARRRDWHPTQIVPLAFLAAILLGTMLLALPIARVGPGAAPLLAALFTATSAISGMVSNINTLSRTPLNIRVNVGVREQPYRIDNSNPYAEHAAGGIFAGPTLIPSIRGTSHLVGESGAEAIMPLHAGPKTLEKMHEDIRALAARPMTTIINLDGRQIASATMPYVDAHVAAKATRGQLARQTVY